MPPGRRQLTNSARRAISRRHAQDELCAVSRVAFEYLCDVVAVDADCTALIEEEDHAEILRCAQLALAVEHVFGPICESNTERAERLAFSDSFNFVRPHRSTDKG